MSDTAADTTASDYAGYAWQRDDDGIVTVTMDDPQSPVNTMNAHFVARIAATVARLEAELEQISGVILRSAKRSWFAGGDLAMLRAADPANAAEETAHITEVKSWLRRLERLGKPVVAALTGSALGGGLEVALAAHHRIAASDVRGIEFGLPEVSLGLLPGAGGVTRTVRMLGLQAALQEVILPATRFSPSRALAVGIIDELAPTAEINARARAFIVGNPTPIKPWDVKGYQLPGGSPRSPSVAALLAAMPALVRKQLKGAPLPAPRAAMAAAVEGAYVDFDTASLIETRYFVSLTHTQIAKNLISAMFFDLQEVTAGTSRPDGIPAFTTTKLAVIGAGMMGGAIAYVAARSGIEVVLIDVDRATAEAGKDYARTREETAVDRGVTSAEASAELLARIHPTDSIADVGGVDLVIEAVVESVPVKQSVLRQAEAVAGPTAVLGSNTSTLPISLLAAGPERPDAVIGIHFFSPVDKMPLVEIVRGAQTSDETLARTFDFVRQIRKTPIVVNDARGFFTTRVISTFMDEAIAAVGEGIEPATVEQAATQAGYPAGALQLIDELSISLMQKIRNETRSAVEAEGRAWVEHPADAVVDMMVDEAGRPGRRAGAGFYDYDDTGARIGLWPGLRDRYAAGGADVSLRDLQERMLFAEALEAVACLDEDVLVSTADANVGSILGIGFPAWTGGVLRYIDQYDGGVAGFVARAHELADTYGERFRPSAALEARAEAGGSVT